MVEYEYNGCGDCTSVQCGVCATDGWNLTLGDKILYASTSALPLTPCVKNKSSLKQKSPNWNCQRHIKMPQRCWRVAAAVRLSRSDSPSVAQCNRTQPGEGEQGQVSVSATSPSARERDQLCGGEDTPRSLPHPMYSHTHTPKTLDLSCLQSLICSLSFPSSVDLLFPPL